MSKYYYIAMQAYGDNVVSLGLLRHLAGRADLTIIGSDLTVETAKLLELTAFPIVTVPGGVSAIYDLGGAAATRIARDFVALLRVIRDTVPSDATLLFENHRRPGTHALLAILAGKFRWRATPWIATAYLDRQAFLEKTFGVPLPLHTCTKRSSPTRKVVLAPAARKAFRAFPQPLLRAVMEYGTRLGWEACLLDPFGQYGDCAALATEYLVRAPLSTGLNRLRGADLLIGADSLFLHLAYFYGITPFALIPDRVARAFYFAPPGLLENGLSLTFEEAQDGAVLCARLDRVLGPR